MSDFVTSPITRCPADINPHIWQFLDECSLARCEAVCTGWRAQIASPDQHVWRNFCHITNRSDFPTREELSEGLKVFQAQPKCDELIDVFTTERTFELIFSYAHDDNTNYKGLATIIRGKVVLKYSSCYLSIPLKDSSLLAEPPWGRREREPFILVEISNEKIRELAKRKWAEGDADAYEAGEKLDDFLGLQRRVECWLPLRLFYNRDGSLKNHGDTLRLNYKGKRMQLECTFGSSMRTIENRTFHTYAEAVVYRIDLSVRNFRWILQGDIDSARAAAMADPREWIPHDMS